jgi:hypothetical protein
MTQRSAFRGPVQERSGRQSNDNGDIIAYEQIIYRDVNRTNDKVQRQGPSHSNFLPLFEAWPLTTLDIAGNPGQRSRPEADHPEHESGKVFPALSIPEIMAHIYW